MKHFLLTSAVLFLAINTARADGHFDIAPVVGTRGIGLEVNKSITQFLSVRATSTTGSLKVRSSAVGDQFDTKLQTRSTGLIFDVHPFGGNFRVSGGILKDNNQLELTGHPDANGNYVFNGNTYSAAQVGTLTGAAKVDALAPYLALGYRIQSGHLVYSADLGAMRQNSIRTTLTASGAALNPALASELAAEAASRQASVQRYWRYHPVLSFSLGYSF